MNAEPKVQALEERLLQLLAEVAPDIDPAAVRNDLEIRDQFDFDSMDLLNFARVIHREFGVDVPERDYRELGSVQRGAAYLRGRLAMGAE